MYASAYFGWLQLFATLLSSLERTMFRATAAVTTTTTRAAAANVWQARPPHFYQQLLETLSFRDY